MSTPTRIKEVREQNGYSRKDFAIALGVPYSTLTNYENGTREPPYDFLLKIAHIFGTTVDYLLCRSNVPEWPSEIGRGTFGEIELERCVAVLLEGTGFVFSNTAEHLYLDMIAGDGESVSITKDEWKQLVSNIVSYATYTTKTLYDKAQERGKDPKDGK